MRKIFLVTLALCLTASVPAWSGTKPAIAHSTKSASATNRAPLAYQLFCLQNPQECKQGKKDHIAVDQRWLRTLQAVNRHVNRSIRPVNDRGRADVWRVGTKAGDCEDFALEKRRRLIKAGVPSGALRMAVVRTPRGEGHAVLVVKTNKGELVLDNLRSSILERKSTGYRWIKMASIDPGVWRAF